eukprot:PhF_6_TR883/c0_g1_i2/m.1347
MRVSPQISKRCVCVWNCADSYSNSWVRLHQHTNADATLHLAPITITNTAVTVTFTFSNSVTFPFADPHPKPIAFHTDTASNNSSPNNIHTNYHVPSKYPSGHSFSCSCTPQTSHSHSDILVRFKC